MAKKAANAAAKQMAPQAQKSAPRKAAPKKAAKKGAAQKSKAKRAMSTQPDDPNTVSFSPSKVAIAELKVKLLAIDPTGHNHVIVDIVDKIDNLDRVLQCQVNMTRRFPSSE